jgi:hypothetical protein
MPPDRQTGKVQQALEAHTWPLPQVETMVPPHPLGLPLSAQPLGVVAVQMHVPDAVLVQPLHAALESPPAELQGQVRFELPGPSWKALLGPAEQAFPWPPLAP